MYDDKENFQSNCVSKCDYFGKNFKPERKYPTIRSHYDQLVGSAPNFMPTSTTNMLIWVTVMETIIKDNLHKDEKEEALKDSV
jgi:hypothetical protein